MARKSDIDVKKSNRGKMRKLTGTKKGQTFQSGEAWHFSGVSAGKRRPAGASRVWARKR